MMDKAFDEMSLNLIGRMFGNTGNIDPISTPIAWLGVCLKAGMRGQATIKAFNIKATGNGD
jgi:hypothetical protein